MLGNFSIACRKATLIIYRSYFSFTLHLTSFTILWLNLRVLLSLTIIERFFSQLFNTTKIPIFLNLLIISFIIDEFRFISQFRYLRFLIWNLIIIIHTLFLFIVAVHIVGLSIVSYSLSLMLRRSVAVKLVLLSQWRPLNGRAPLLLVIRVNVSPIISRIIEIRASTLKLSWFLIRFHLLKKTSKLSVLIQVVLYLLVTLHKLLMLWR